MFGRRRRRRREQLAFAVARQRLHDDTRYLPNGEQDQEHAVMWIADAGSAWYEVRCADCGAVVLVSIG